MNYPKLMRTRFHTIRPIEVGRDVSILSGEVAWDSAETHDCVDTQCVCGGKRATQTLRGELRCRKCGRAQERAA